MVSVVDEINTSMERWWNENDGAKPQYLEK
jgi:hypothetical protein